MGKASISIAIGALWNGQTQIDAVTNSIQRMALNCAKSSASTTRSLALQGERWVDLGNQIHNAGTSIANVGDTLTSAITVPMTKVGGYCVDQAVSFDTAIANLRKTSDLTADQLGALGRAAIEASRQQPVDAATIVNIEALGAQLGVADDNLQSFARTVSGLDIATNMDADTAATEMARFANITGMAESEFSNYGSTIVAIGNNMATTESEVSSLAQRFASAGTAAGMSQADILGMSGALSSLGVKAEMGGSALSQTVNAIGVAVSQGGDDLDAFAEKAGMSADEFAAAWRDDAAGTFSALVESMGRSVAAGEDVNVMLSDLGITGIRQSDVMRRLIDSTESVTGKQSVLASALGLSRSAWEENAALQAEVDQRNESMQSRLDVLRNKVNAVAIEVGTPLTNALIDAMDALQPLFRGVADAAQAFADMDEEDQRTILSLAGVAAAAGPVLSTVGRLVQGIGNVNTAWGRAQEKAAIYGDALNTVDGSQMRNYASSREIAAQLGSVQNAAAKAAGGAERYVSAWEGMTDSAKVVRDTTTKIDALSEKQRGLGEESVKAKAKIEKQIGALEGQRSTAKKAYEDNASLVTAWSKSSSEATKAADGIGYLSDSLERVKTGTTDTAQKMQAVAQGTGGIKGAATNAGNALKDMASKAGEATSAFGSGLSNGIKLAASSALDMAKNFAVGALQAGAVGLAIAGVGAAIGAVVGAYQKQAERADNLSKATDGLTEATNKSIKAAQDQSVAHEDSKASLGDAREAVDKAVESQARLAESLGKANSQASAQMGQLQAAYSVIQEYANQSGLSAQEQGRLRAAVEQFNGIAGTQVEVTDAANGKLSEQGEEIENVTSKLGGYMQKKLEQIRLEAYQDRLGELYRKQAEDMDALTTAQMAYNQRVEELGSKADYVADYVSKYKELGVQSSLTSEELERYAEAAYEGELASARVESGLGSAREAFDAIGGSISTTEAMMGSAAQASDGMAASVALLAKSNGMVSSACSSAGVDIDQFSKALADTGMSVEKLKDINDADWAQIVAAYATNSESLVSTLEQLGVDMGDSGDRAVQALADGLLSGREGVGDAASELIQLAGSGDWPGLAETMRGHGFAIPSELAAALESNGGAPSEAASRMLSLVAVKLAGGDLDEAAKILGGNIDEGLANGIREGTLSEEEAAALGEDVIEKANDTFETHSPSRVFHDIGVNVDAGLASGIDENSDAPVTSASNLGKAVVDGIGGIVSTITGIGSQSGSGFAGGILDWSGPASESGAALREGAEGGARGTEATLSSEGAGAGRQFAHGISSFVGRATSAAGQLFSGVVGATSGTPGRLGGYGSDASSKFASGIGANAHAVLAQANAIASNAMKAKSYGNSYQWGTHLAGNFASGIEAGLGWVASAARGIANAAASILHFSVPSDGPWSGSERGGMTSGLHLAQNIASGMMRGLPDVERAALSVAGAATVPVPSLGARAVGAHGSKYGDRESGIVSTTNNWNLTINGAQLQNASPRAQELIGELFGEFGLVASMS
ncbi:MAG: phage tail tape measure protein [Coriobacteriaceae bacterium]|nr:phage tail tape measure protein [Coriobacteriaceae bacterium]